MDPSQPSGGDSRADYPVLRELGTRWLDNDAYGHVNNVVYYSYIDSAVNGWLIERCGIDIVGLRLEKLGHSSVIYQLGIFGGSEASAAALARFVHVYVDARSRRPVGIPQRIRTALEALAG